jgi:hypothetical protein
MGPTLYGRGEVGAGFRAGTPMHRHVRRRITRAWARNWQAHRRGSRSPTGGSLPGGGRGFALPTFHDGERQATALTFVPEEILTYEYTARPDKPREKLERFR